MEVEGGLWSLVCPSVLSWRRPQEPPEPVHESLHAWDLSRKRASFKKPSNDESLGHDLKHFFFKCKLLFSRATFTPVFHARNLGFNASLLLHLHDQKRLLCASLSSRSLPSIQLLLPTFLRPKPSVPLCLVVHPDPSIYPSDSAWPEHTLCSPISPVADPPWHLHQKTQALRNRPTPTRARGTP